MSNIKALEKQIINNSIKPLGGGLPQTFNDIDKLPYVFSKPTVIDKDLYKVSVKLVEVNGFYYPAEIFTGEVKSYKTNEAFLYLKPKYKQYGINGSLLSKTRKKKFENMITTKVYNIDPKKMIFIDDDFIDYSK